MSVRDTYRLVVPSAAIIVAIFSCKSVPRSDISSDKWPFLSVLYRSSSENASVNHGQAMTHPNFQTNGASLEDCHTNFFALMDLCGIKWRRLSADNLYCVDPLDDPVLLAFTKCLAADILCVWRRVPHQRTHLEQHRYLQELNAPPPLLYKKELWIFWYGNEPTDLNNILCSELSEVEQGPLDTGLNYECRTLLFKAIHNRIERSALPLCLPNVIANRPLVTYRAPIRNLSCNFRYGEDKTVKPTPYRKFSSVKCTARWTKIMETRD